MGHAVVVNLRLDRYGMSLFCFLVCFQWAWDSSVTHTNLPTFDKVHNQDSRFISGAMMTTPTSAREIECNIEPLDWMLTEAWTPHSNKALIQTWRKKTRLKQHSCLTRATTFLPEYNLPCSREKIATVASHPLYGTAYQPTLCKHLIVEMASKADPAHIHWKAWQLSLSTRI